MNSTVENEMRDVVAKYLPKAIDKAMTSYDLYLEGGAHDKIEDFKSHHEACKVALAHVALLIDMGDWVGKRDPKGEDIIDLASIIENAGKEAKTLEKFDFAE